MTVNSEMTVMFDICYLLKKIIQEGTKKDVTNKEYNKSRS